MAVECQFRLQVRRDRGVLEKIEKKEQADGDVHGTM